MLVEDDEDIRELVQLYLINAGYRVTALETGEQAMELVTKEKFDLFVLDIMLPDTSGMELCRRIRAGSEAIILFLTCKRESDDIVAGLEIGADDYVVKPFSPREVIYRVKAILRRSSVTAYLSKEVNTSNNIVFPNLVIEHDAHRVTAGGQEVALTPKEYELLHYLAVSPDKVFSREELLKDVWNYEFFGDLRTVDTHVKRLREKLNKVSPDAAGMITTVWGVGYKLEVPK